MRTLPCAASGAIALALTVACGRTGPWKEVAVGFHGDIRDIRFLDPANGWMVGGDSAVEGGEIARTRDGGKTWTVVKLVEPLMVRAANYFMVSVQFVDGQRGWISGQSGRILRTDDGGEHWDELRVPARTLVQDVFFLDHDTGWALTWSEVLLTTDGGEHWSRGAKLAGRFRAIRFLDRQNGIVVGPGGIQRSWDGGQGWQRVEVPDIEYWAVDFPSPGAGWVVGERGTVLHTTDGGAGWQAQASGVRTSLRGVHFLDEQRGWVVGKANRQDKSLILRTEDSGTTWTLQQEVPGLALETIAAVDDRHAWTAGRRLGTAETQVVMRLSH